MQRRYIYKDVHCLIMYWETKISTPTSFYYSAIVTNTSLLSLSSLTWLYYSRNSGKIKLEMSLLLWRVPEQASPRWHEDYFKLKIIKTPQAQEKLLPLRENT